MMTERADTLVVGSGIAGLLFALRMAERGSVILLTKADRAFTNTGKAQGGIAAVSYTHLTLPTIYSV